MTTEKTGLTIEQYKNLQRPFDDSEINFSEKTAKGMKALDNNWSGQTGWHMFTRYLQRGSLLARLNEATGSFSLKNDFFDGKSTTTLSILVDGTWITHSDFGGSTTDSDKVSNIMKDGSAATYGLKRVCQIHNIGLGEKYDEPVALYFDQEAMAFSDNAGNKALNPTEARALLINISTSRLRLQEVYHLNKQLFDEAPELLDSLKLIANHVK